MNDFTKMELIALENAMANILRMYPPPEGKSPLLEKIQTMIEGHCEHGGDYFEFSKIVNACQKCGRVFR